MGNETGILQPVCNSTFFRALATSILVALTTLGSGCGSEKSAEKASRFILTGTAWVAEVDGAGETNHDPNVVISRSVITTTGAITGLGQGWNGREVSVTIPMTEDLGDYGSLSLIAEVYGYPLSNGAYAPLVSLHDGTNELVNMARANSGGDCAQSGAFTCTSGSCSNNAACAPNWPSAFYTRDNWLQHQFDFAFGGMQSVNTFPTCNWSGGSGSASNQRQCAFNSDFFVSNKLRFGANYTAKFVILADSYRTISGSPTASLKVTVVKKKRAVNTASSAIDVNLIFVGNQVSQSSRNAQGKVNLNTLMTAVQDFYSQSTTNIKIGTIRTVEWTDEGEAWTDLSTSEFGEMVQASASLIPAATSGKAVNIYFVNSISDPDYGSSILGASGGIGGPMLNGYANSGMVVSTFGKLDEYNPSCTVAPCVAPKLERDFQDFEQTIAHEMGHYLGLNHVSESAGDAHDPLRDTPICTTKAGGTDYITIDSCRTLDSNVYPATSKTCLQSCTGYNRAAGLYCATAPECGFNYIMYWSSKNYTASTGAGDGNIFSAQSGLILNYHPLVQ